MAKLTGYCYIIGALVASLLSCATAGAQYQLQLKGVDKTESFLKDSAKIQTKFSSRDACMQYVSSIPKMLNSKGFPYASVDSIAYDSLSAYCLIYMGEPMRYTYLNTTSIDPAIVQYANLNRPAKKPLDFQQFGKLQETILTYLENNGYPFASVSMDSIRFQSDTLQALLKIEKGPLYKIDSIRNEGSASISQAFLQQYLGIKNGSIYRKERLQSVSGKILELPFLFEKRPWNLTLLGTGSILNVYLDTKKSSEVNVIVGLLPANEQLASNTMLITGDANINLRNALGGGETIGLNWQQIQVKSPRLNVAFTKPYLFGSPFGLNFNFDLLKKDSSYVNIGILIGAAYALSARQTGSVFLQRLTTNLLTVDTFTVKSSRRLPPEADMSSVNVGVNYEVLSTDYRFNPRSGNEFFISTSTGTKTIRKNNVIVKLQDPGDPSFSYGTLYDTFQLKSYQFRVRLRAAHYIKLGRAATFKTAINGGWFESPNIFRNELFQIGGYKLLRGFDEESIFASRYGVLTGEYRYLIGQNSFLSAFADYGVTGNSQQQAKSLSNNFLGLGIGMAFETKAGIFNINYAVGKRDAEKINLRQSKIHLGFATYF